MSEPQQAEISKAGPSAADEPWPLPYQLKRQLLEHGKTDSPKKTKPYWKHSLYRGPNDEPVEILYSKTRAQSEAIAQKFVNEPVLGFDMEWPWWDAKSDRLQHKVGLIQIASESRIGLFHIGVHYGTTTEQLIAPTLRRIIESPTISKCGVAVMNADGKRLREHFKLEPKGLFELSHLHNVVEYGATQPGRLTTRLVALNKLVDHHLGFPLSKGKVRTSNWSKPLDQKQIDYAASDAYAGFMLYHCMDAKRRCMDPVLALPAHAESYLPWTGGGGGGGGRRLQSQSGEVIQGKAADVSQSEADMVANEQVLEPDDAAELPISNVPEEEKGEGESEAKLAGSRKKRPKVKTPDIILDAESEKLYHELAKRRKEQAAEEVIPPYRIASNDTLKQMCLQRPTTSEALLLVKGIGRSKQQKYGVAWLEIITNFNSQYPSPAAPHPTTPPPKARKTPQLHTGVTFYMAKTHLEAPDDSSQDDELSSSSPAFDTPLATPSRRRVQRVDSVLPVSPALSTLEMPPLKRVHETGSRHAISEPPSSWEAALSPRRKRMKQTPPPQPPCASVPINTTQTKAPILPSEQKPSVQEAPMTPRSRRFHAILTALGKRVSKKPLDAVVSTTTIKALVNDPPSDWTSLYKIPEISQLVLACEKEGVHLLNFICKHAPSRTEIEFLDLVNES